jgi:peptidoglycan/LPS O-acetylase OafA/YrhL
MIKPLTSLRFFFAFMVFLSHLNFLYGIDKESKVNLDSFVKIHIAFSEGYLGVSFFFILSGFILTYNYCDKFKEKSINFKSYLRARFFRIIPLHWLTLLVSIILSAPYVNDITNYILKVASNASLIQSFIPLQEYFFSFNGVSWSISNEMFFYVLFPFLVIWIYKRKANYYIASILLLIPLILLFIFKNHEYSYWLFYINPLLRVFDFVLGILIFKVYQKLKSLQIKFNPTFLEFIAISVLVLFLFFKEEIHQSFRWSVYYWIPMLLVILVFALQEGKISKLLSHHFFVLLGEISFSFYMIHQIVIKLLWAVNFKLKIIESSILVVLLAFFISIVLSYVTYKYFEIPINRKFKK